MLTTQQKIERLEMAIALLQDADAGMQTALGDTEECYDLHNTLENIADDLQDIIQRLKA